MKLKGLIVGLGNPGTQYAQTRHNVGFMTLDKLMLKASSNAYSIEKLSGRKFNTQLWSLSLLNGDKWLLAEPQTFMNLSGDAVQPILAWYKLTPENLLVVHDELELPPGRLKIKKGGSAAGHNGIKSIQQRLGTPEFYRLRVGTGKPNVKDQTISWVLSRFSENELESMEKSIEDAVQAILHFCIDGSERAMNIVNINPVRKEKDSTEITTIDVKTNADKIEG